MLNLKEKYNKEVIQAMREKFHYKNDMAVPKIEKVIINTGFGRLVSDKTNDERKKIGMAIADDLALIAGQAPVLTKAKKSIAGFKIREGMIIGAMVALRRKKMYDFLDRLIHIALPRLRDFRGIDTKSVDKSGNLCIAIKEHISFPEISPEKSKVMFGFEVVIATTAKNKEEGIELFRLLGFPLKK